jgi:hypothetical protein
LSALTKMFIVLQLVFALVCAVLLILFISKTENYKTTASNERATSVGLAASLVDTQRAKATADTRAETLQSKLNETFTQLTQAKAEAAANLAKQDAAIQDLKNQLAGVNAKNDTLTAANSTDSATIAANNAELARLRPLVADLTKQYNEVYRAKNEVDNQLKAAELAIRKLQETIAQMPGGGAGAVAPVGSESQIQVLTASSAATVGKVNGRISDVAQAQGRTLIEMPLGERDGIKVGTKMYVYRASGYVGDATVERVSPDQAVAVVISTKPGEAVKVGDLIATVGQ